MKMKINKILQIVLIMVMVLTSLTACGKKSENTGEEITNNSEQTETVNSEAESDNEGNQAVIIETDTSSKNPETSSKEPQSDTTEPEDTSRIPQEGLDVKEEVVSGEEISCPKFVGQRVEDVFSNTDYTDNFSLEQKWEYNADYAEGTVYKQSVSAGKKIGKYTVITLYISMGPESINIPELQGKTEAAAVSQLKSLGLKVTVKKEACKGIEKGLVIRVEPKTQSKIVSGSEVIVYISG